MDLPKLLVLVALVLCTCGSLTLSLNFYNETQAQKPVEISLVSLVTGDGSVCDQINLVRTYRTKEGWIGVSGQPKLITYEGPSDLELKLYRNQDYAINVLCRQESNGIVTVYMAASWQVSVSREGEVVYSQPDVFEASRATN